MNHYLTIFAQRNPILIDIPNKLHVICMYTVHTRKLISTLFIQQGVLRFIESHYFMIIKVKMST